MADTVALMSATELLRRYRDGSLSPVEATRAALAAIERHDKTVNAFVMVDEEGALAAARDSEERWRRGTPKGRLDGVPATVKDLVLARGWPTLRGSRTVDPDGPWSEDAPATARLRENGAVLLGKTTSPEFGWKGVTDSPRTGITRNPWNTTRTPGGSSGGAAVAAALGMGALHIGTDGGGSIRMPCAFTGLPGLKPSFGRVPAYPPSPFGTLAHVGPMARTVADNALMLGVMAAPDVRDPYALPKGEDNFTAELARGVKGLRVAYLPTLNDQPVDPEIAKLVKSAVARIDELGAHVEQPEPELPDMRRVFRIHWYAGAAMILRPMSPEKRAMIDPGLQEVAAEGDGYTLSDYQAAVAEREAYCVTLSRLHERYDLIMTPTLPLAAFEAGREFPEGKGYKRWPDWTPFSYPFNLTGQPAGTVPCGLTGEGLPTGLQIVGPRYADSLVLAAMHAFEAVCPPSLPAIATEG